MKRYLVPQGVQAQDLIAMTVHDLRTPVTAIKGFGQLALRQLDLPAAARQHLDMVVNETNRIAALIDDLVLLASLEHGDEVAHPAVVNLAQLLDGVIQDASRTGLAGRCALASDVRPIRAVCDPALLERAVANLIRYALKYSSKGEPVLLATRLTPEGPAIVVSSDCGRENGHHAGRSVNGRTGHEDPELFVPGDLNPRGLGMYISAKLIDIQHGQLWIDTGIGTDARILVVLSS